LLLAVHAYTPTRKSNPPPLPKQLPTPLQPRHIKNSAGQFYIKFSMRQYLGDVLAYAWGLPAHREAWKAFALGGDDWPYLRFTNMLIGDATYLLDESLKYIKVRGGGGGGTGVLGGGGGGGGKGVVCVHALCDT
jgi:hypothetical protein